MEIGSFVGWFYMMPAVGLGITATGPYSVHKMATINRFSPDSVRRTSFQY